MAPARWPLEWRITGVLLQERILHRPAPAVALDPHPPLIAVDRALARVGVIEQIRLDHLERKRHLAAAERLPHLADEHLTRLGHRANHQALHVVPAQPSAGVAVLFLAPDLPGALDRVIHLRIEPPAAAHHPHLRLHLDAGADHVVFHRADRLPRVVVIAHQLARAVPEPRQAALDLSVGAGAGRHPVAGKPAHHRALVHPPPWCRRGLGGAALQPAEDRGSDAHQKRT